MIKKIVKIVKITLRVFMALLCGTGMAAILFVASYYFFYTEEAVLPGQGLQVRLFNDVSPTVHYGDNMIFEPGPQPTENIHYLTPFTENIAFRNNFSAHFNREVNVAYKFLVTANMTIRRDGTSGANIYNQTFLIDEIEGTESGTYSLTYNYYRPSVTTNDEDEDEWDWDWYGEEFPPDWEDYPENIAEFNTIEYDDWDAASERPGEIPRAVTELYLYEYIDILDELVSELTAKTGIYASCSAEITVEFINRIYVKEYGLDETITCSIVFPLRKDVFNFVPPVAETKTASGRLDPRAVIGVIIEDENTPYLVTEFLDIIIENENVSETYIIFLLLLMLPLFAAGFYFSVGGRGLIKAMGRLFKRVGGYIDKYIGRHIWNKDYSFDREAERLLKKYTNEIMITSTAIKRYELEVNTFTDFQELLKLSLYINKPIFCYRHEEYVEFSVIYDGFIHCYIIYKKESLTFSEDKTSVEEV